MNSHSRVFTALASGKRHYRTQHMEATPIECIFCRKMLKNEAASVVHLKKIHDVTKKQVEEAKKIEMDGEDYLLVISEKNVVGFLK